MESKEVKKVKTRSNSKASKPDERSASTEEEMAPNVNGGEDGGSEIEMVNTPTEEDIEKNFDTLENKENSEKGRKRKASEIDENFQDLDDSFENPDENKAESKNDSSIDSSYSPKENLLNNEDDTMNEPDALNLSSEMLNIPDKLDPITQQSLGKGKRARVPNKRYSDIAPAKLNFDSPKPKPENGQIQENEIIRDEPESDSGIAPTPVKRPLYSSPIISASKKIKAAVDLSNPNFLKPFKYGWKRELVYRANSDISLKRNGDIYYYTPTGKKVRSMREVAENLINKELSIDDFTFFKEPLGLADPEKEIIRDAKFKTGTPSGIKKTSTPKLAKAPVKTAPKSPKASLISSPTTGESTKVKSPKISSGGFKVKVKGTPNKKSKKKSENNMEIGTYPPNWNSPSRKAKSPSFTETDNKPCRPCSIRCPGVLGVIPTLQCHICLCLYHNQCVGVSLFTKAEGYICKNCRLEHDTNAEAPNHTVPSPPMIPINLLNEPNSIEDVNNVAPTIQPSNLPTLQRIPQLPENVISQSIDPLYKELPKLTPKPGLKPKFVEPTKGILGAITSWFPPSSTIKVGNETTRDLSPRPQYVEFVGNKKYVIVPRHNVLSVAPVTQNIQNELTETKIERQSPLLDDNDTSINTNADEIISKSGDSNTGETISKIDDINTDEIISKNNTNADEIISNNNTNSDEIVSKSNTKPIPDSNPSPDESISITNPEESISIACQNPDESISNTNLDEPIPIKSTNPDEPLSPLSNGDQHEDSNEDQHPSPDEESEKSIGVKLRSPSKLSKPKATNETKAETVKIDDAYLQSLAYGYKTLLYVFQYLKVQDLLRAGCVCTMWRDLARHQILWNTVRMKNSQIHSFEGLANALLKHGTVHLDLRKMLLPTSGGDDIWPSFTTAIKKVESLRKIELCRCLASVVEDLARNNHNLEAINAVTIKCESMTFEPFSNLKNLTDLRLKSTTGLSLTSDLTALKELTKLKHLSITSIKDLYKLNIDVIGELVNIEVLDLGECTDFPKHFGPDILRKLVKLEKLRLEKGQGECYTFDILEAVKDIKTLTQLELVNFDIKAGFDKALGTCVNIKKLLMIPTYISQSATTNHMVLGGVLKLQKTLSHFVWGVTLELLRVTELFVDQCEQPEKKEISKDKNITTGDSIPVLKPVPLHGMPQQEPPAVSSADTPQVEILPLPNLQKLLLQNLPTTRVKILKIPFHATWRQSITDSVN